MIDEIAKVLKAHFPKHEHWIDQDGEPTARFTCACGDDTAETRLEWARHVALKLVDFNAGLFARVRLLEEKFRQGATPLQQLAQQTHGLATTFVGAPLYTATLLAEHARQLSGLATAFEALSDLDNRDPSIKPRCMVTNEPVDEVWLFVDVPKPCDCVVCSTMREHLLDNGALPLTEIREAGQNADQAASNPLPPGSEDS